VIVIEVKKYSTNAKKLSAKAGKQIEEHDVKTVTQVMTER